MVDIDTDGDLDIVFADDQAAVPPAAFSPDGIDRGFIHVFLNDGCGHFTDHPIIVNAFATGAWMGLSFGDLNCDGTLDLFCTNFGDYGVGSVTGFPEFFPLGFLASRWFLGNGDGTFTDPGVGDIVATPFGWGTAMFDYDNDCDLDILSHGGIESVNAIVADNPGAIHQNQSCTAEFVIDHAAIPDDPTCVDLGGQPIPNCTEHIRRNVRGVAVGDLDGNGFMDIVTVASLISAPPLPLLPAPDNHGSAFDDSALFVPIMAATPDGFVWLGLHPVPGDLAVEMSSGNGNGWAAVTVRGSIGLTALGRVNRDGIGAVLSFTPTDSGAVMVPVTGREPHREAGLHAAVAVHEHGRLWEHLLPGVLHSDLAALAGSSTPRRGAGPFGEGASRSTMRQPSATSDWVVSATGSSASVECPGRGSIKEVRSGARFLLRPASVSNLYSWSASFHLSGSTERNPPITRRSPKISTSACIRSEITSRPPARSSARPCLTWRASATRTPRGSCATSDS